MSVVVRREGSESRSRWIPVRGIGETQRLRICSEPAKTEKTEKT